MLSNPNNLNHEGQELETLVSLTHPKLGIQATKFGLSLHFSQRTDTSVRKISFKDGCLRVTKTELFKSIVLNRVKIKQGLYSEYFSIPF